MKQDSGCEIIVESFVRTIADAAIGQGFVPEERREALATERGDKQFIVIAAAPKSGSTFLAYTLSTLSALRYFRLCSGYSSNEHDLYLPALCLMNRYGCVSQMHMKGTYHNMALMRTFGIRPIILVRNVYDTVISLSRDLRRKEQLEEYDTGLNGYSFVWLDQCVKGMSEERLLDFIIDMAIPWYVNFYVSWFRLCEQDLVDAMWLTYEELFKDKEGTIRQVMGFLGIESQVRIDKKLLTKRYITFNEGSPGKGLNVLSEQQMSRIRERFSYYPDVDFSRCGL